MSRAAMPAALARGTPNRLFSSSGSMMTRPPGVVIITVAWPTNVIDTVPGAGRGTGSAAAGAVPSRRRSKAEPRKRIDSTIDSGPRSRLRCSWSSSRARSAKPALVILRDPGAHPRAARARRGDFRDKSAGDDVTQRCAERARPSTRSSYWAAG